MTIRSVGRRENLYAMPTTSALFIGDHHATVLAHPGEYHCTHDRRGVCTNPFPHPTTRSTPHRAMAGSLVCLWAGDSRLVCYALPTNITDVPRAGDGQTRGFACLLRRIVQVGSTTNDLAHVVYRNRYTSLRGHDGANVQCKDIALGGLPAL
jgi:hypothetical protein